MRRRCWRLLHEQQRRHSSSSSLIPATAAEHSSRELLATKCEYVKALYGYGGDKQASTVGDYRSKQAARMALQNFLHFRRGLPLDDAVLISENAPRYIQSLLERLQVEAGRESYEQLRRGMEDMLQGQVVDEMEPFLESLGVQEGFSATSLSLTGENGLLRTAKALEEVGISRKTFWKLLAHNPNQLLHYSLRDCLDTVGILQAVGISKCNMDRAVLHCPSAFKVELQEELGPCVAQLERLGLSRLAIGDIILAAPTKLEHLKNVNMEALAVGMAREVGLPLEESIRLLRENPLLIVGTSLAKVSQVVRYLVFTLVLEQHEVTDLIQRYPRILALNVEKSLSSKVDYLRQQLCIQRPIIKRSIFKYPEALAFSLDDNLKPKVAFLENIGYDRFNLGGLLDKHPSLLLDIMANDLKRKANFLVKNGVKEEFLAGILHAYPQYIRSSLQDVRLRLNYLGKLGADAAMLADMVKRHPALMGYDENSRMKPVVEYVSSLGLGGRAAVLTLISLKPAVLGAEIDSLARAVAFFDGLGYKRSSEAFTVALAMCFRVPESFMEARMRVLAGLGLSHEHVLALVQNQVKLLYTDDEESIARLNYYINVMKLPVHDLLRFPHFLRYSLDTVIKPRHRLISWLKSNRIVKRDYPCTYLHMSKLVFEQTFAECHPQARNVYNGKLPSQPLLLPAALG